MAKKRNTGINLLKGIQGSKLAALITILVILFAIPLTVNLSRQQQNLEQDAAVKDKCGTLEPRGGKCITDSYPNFPNCVKSGGKVKTGYCPGKTQFCCIPQGIDKCVDIGHCQYTTVPCKSGKWKSNLCPGKYLFNFKCCLDK